MFDEGRESHVDERGDSVDSGEREVRRSDDAAKRYVNELGELPITLWVTGNY